MNQGTMRFIENGRSYRAVVAILVLVMLVGFGFPALAAYPERPIELVIPFGVGGSADIEGRAVASALEEILGVPVLPVNRPGGGGAVAYNFVRNAAPDGYTLAWNSTSLLTAYHTGTMDFDYTGLVNIANLLVMDMPLAVRAEAPWSTFEEFIAEGRAKPRSIRIGHAGHGSGTHLGAIALARAVGIDIIDVPLGAERRIASLLGGEVHGVVTPLPEIEAQVRSGQARLLVFPSNERNPGYPDVPTARELGYPVSVQIFRGVSAPPGTPQEIVNVLVEALRQVTELPSFQRMADEAGLSIAFMGPEEFNQYLAEQDAIIGDVMAAINAGQ